MSTWAAGFRKNLRTPLYAIALLVLGSASAFADQHRFYCSAAPQTFQLCRNGNTCPANIDNNDAITVEGVRPGTTISINTTYTGAVPGTVHFHAQGQTADFSPVTHTYTVSGETYFTGSITATSAGTEDIQVQIENTPGTTGAQLLSYTVNCNPGPTTGSVTIKKTAQGSNGTFNFTSSFPTGSFGLTTVGGSASQTFGNLTPATYTVAELSTKGWDFTNLLCTGGKTAATVAGATATIPVAAGDNITCEYINTAQTGSITIKKTTFGSNGSFNFTSATLGNFSLVTSGGGASRTFSSLTAGTYAVTEAATAGWNFTSLTCSGGATAATVTGPTASIPLGLGENITCEYTNTFATTGSITIRKGIVGGATGTSFNFTTSGAGLSNFALTSVAEGQFASQTFSALTAGAFTITEASVTNWSLTSLTCTGGASVNVATPTVTINLAANENVICTYTNTFVPPVGTGTIKIVKRAIGGDGTFGFTSSANFGVAAFSLTTASGTASRDFASLAPGQYTIQETSMPAGWSFSSLSCSTSVGSGTSAISGQQATITLNANDNIVCTYTDTLITTGSITIRKTIIGGTTGTSFNFTATGAGLSDFSLTSVAEGGFATRTFLGLTAGTFTVTEASVTSWNLTSLTCTGGASVNVAKPTVTINLAANENVICTYTNTFVPPAGTGTIKIVKSAIGGNGIFGFTASANFSVTSFNLTTASGTANRDFASLAPGQYTIQESSMPAGWSFTSLSCSVVGSGTSVISGQQATLTLNANDNIVCTFTDTLVTAGSITIRKTIIGGQDGTAFSFTTTGAGLSNFALAPSAGALDSKTFLALSAGTYTITETAIANWAVSSLTCTGGSSVGTVAPTVTINLAAGENVDCTYTNIFRSPVGGTGTIKIVKSAINANGTFGFITSANFGITTFSLTTAGSATGGTASRDFPTLAAGQYTIQESSMPAGWNFTNLSCSVIGTGTAVVSGSGATITLQAGDNIVCTFTNTGSTAPTSSTITIVKRTLDGRDGTFSFASTIPGATSFVLATHETTAVAKYSNLANGNYTISEVGMGPGWGLSSLTCTDPGATINVNARSATVTIAGGVGVTCTFINAFNEEKIRSDTSSTIRNFMNRRADIIVSEEPDRNRYIRRLTGSLWGECGGDAAPFSFTGSSSAATSGLSSGSYSSVPETTSGQMSFSTSSNQIA
jgi:hypothetical protein